MENGLFTDQKWINFAPVFFDGVAIVKSARHNVATWNLTTRRVTGSFDAGFEVDGEPLSFYHFTGFDSGAHRIMAIKNAAASPPVQRLIAWYEQEIAVAEGDPVSKWPWAFGRFSDGTAIAAAHRFLYREHPDLQAAFPDPYDATPGKATFLRWCNTEGRVRYPELMSAKGLDSPPKMPIRGRRFAGRCAAALVADAPAQVRQGVAGEGRRRVAQRRIRGHRAAAHAPAIEVRMIDVIIPVYKGARETRRCLGSVLASAQRARFEVVVVDDASPDSEITAFVNELAAARAHHARAERIERGIRPVGQPRHGDARRS